MSSIDQRLKRLVTKGGYKNPFDQRARVHGDNRRVKGRTRKKIGEWLVDENGCLSRRIGEQTRTGEADANKG